MHMDFSSSQTKMIQSPYSFVFCVALFNTTTKVSFTIIYFHLPFQQTEHEYKHNIFFTIILRISTSRFLINIYVPSRDIATAAVNGQLAINNTLKHSAVHP